MPTPGGDGTEGDPLPDNVLFELYEQYIGEPDGEIDVYLGFGLFFGGIAMAGFALLLFLWSGFYGPRTDPYFARAGAAYALGMLALPAVLVGVVVLLPTEKRARYASFGGGVVSLLAVAGFLYAYPSHWNGYGNDYTVQVVGVYAVGMTALVASTGAALVAHQLERIEPTVVEKTIEGGSGDAAGGDEESWTDAEIRADIDEAMSNADISWGGVERDDTRSLNLNLDMQVDSSELNIDPDTTRSEGVDAQVTGLKQMKGADATDKTTTQESTVDDQTAALTELKQKRREGETPDPTDDEKGNITDRLRGILD